MPSYALNDDKGRLLEDHPIRIRISRCQREVVYWLSYHEQFREEELAVPCRRPWDHLVDWDRPWHQLVDWNRPIKQNQLIRLSTLRL